LDLVVKSAMPKLQTIACFATIIAAIFVVLNYFGPFKENEPKKTDPLLTKPPAIGDSIKPPSLEKASPEETLDSKEGLSIAFNVAQEIHNRNERDSTYQKIVNQALYINEYDFALKVSAQIYSRQARDDTYMSIILRAIQARRFDSAQKASKQIYNRTTRDKAKKMIIDAIGPPPSIQ